MTMPVTTETPIPPDMPPRYAIGELVMVRSAIDPARNTDCTRVIDRQWFEGEAEWGWYRGWQYVVAKHVDAWAVQHSLRPRPEASHDDWASLKEHLAWRHERIAEPA